MLEARMERRNFLTLALGAAGTTLLGCRRRGGSLDGELIVATADAKPAPSAGFTPDLELSLQAAPQRLNLFSGRSTDVWRFTGALHAGSPGALATMPEGYLGPVLRVRTGQRVRIRFDNRLPESSIVHWHGLYVPEQSDGHPAFAVAPGRSYTYDFEVTNRAGLYWYHPHPDQRTGSQVYRGLAGLILVSDDEERRLALPDGDREQLLVLQDRLFDGDGQLSYEYAPMLGFLGDQVLVNGALPAPIEQSPGPHRLRILNGSNSRVYDLAWSDGSPLVVLGTDGGLLEAPRERAHVVLAPGQRLDVWADFGNRPAADVWLESRAFVAPGMSTGMGMMGMRMGMGRGFSLPSAASQGAPFRLQRFVTTGTALAKRPPARLAAPTPKRSARPAATKQFSVGMGMMHWQLNGGTFRMREVAANERVRMGTEEVWEFDNSDGPMAMAHPIHIHGRQFRIVGREVGSATSSLKEGLLDDGWLDTFLLLPGERVRVLVRFDKYPGLFLYHCHNLEHEDLGMMRNFLVEHG
jgi:FtsP/CotA-like multicopper oxidase with cupredoxin domain